MKPEQAGTDTRGFFKAREVVRIFSLGVAVAGLLSGSAALAEQASWLQDSHDAARTNHQPHETKLGVGNVKKLRQRWSYTPPYPLGHARYAKGLIGVCAGQAFVTLDPATGTELAKRVDLDSSCRSPAMTNTRLFVESTDDSDGLSHLRSYDKKLSPLWNAESSGKTNGYMGPAVEDGKVVVADRANGVYAYRAGNGTPLWRQDTHSRSVNSGPPVIGAGKVFVSAYTQWLPYDIPTLYAFDANTGAVAWTRGQDATWGSRPVVLAGDKLIVVGDDVVALDANTGVDLWRRHVTNFVEQTAVAGNRLYVIGVSALQAMDVDTGDVIWTVPFPGVNSNLASDLVVANGVIYYMRRDNVWNESDLTLYAVNASNGKDIPIGRQPRMIGFYNGLAVADGLVMVSTTWGTLHVFSVDR